MKTKNMATFYAILAAALYAVNIPLSKILLREVEPTMMAAFLYLGAGAGLFLYGRITGERQRGEPLTRAELPYTIGMIVLDIAAPILLMLGLERTNSANASLLNNFEIVATTLIALLVFREALSRRLVISIALVTAASITLSFEGAGSFRFNGGSLLVLGAACCWGLENNCTRMLSSKSSVQITTIAILLHKEKDRPEGGLFRDDRIQWWSLPSREQLNWATITTVIASPGGAWFVV